MQRLPLVLVALLAAASVSASAPAAGAPWKAVIQDWYADGSFERPHACSAVRAAIARLPTSGREYSTVIEDHRAYAALVCASPRRPRVGIAVRHRYDMRRLPYPEGVLYTVAIRRPGGRPVRWAHFAGGPPYRSTGLAAAATFTSQRLPAGRYIVMASARPCGQPNGGCRTLAPPQEACVRRLELAPPRQTIAVFARSGDRCRIALYTG